VELGQVHGFPVARLAADLHPGLVGHGLRAADRARADAGRDRQALRHRGRGAGRARRKLLWRYPARHALGPIINSLGFDLNRIFNELPIVALILTLTEAGALLIEALARSNDQQLAGAIIFLLTASIVALNFVTDVALALTRPAHPQGHRDGGMHDRRPDDAPPAPRRDRPPSAGEGGLFHRLAGPADLGAVQEAARGDGRGRGAAGADPDGLLRAVPVALRSDHRRAQQGLHQRRAADPPMFCDDNGCSLRPFIYKV
jgi:hypothetical protein